MAPEPGEQHHRNEPGERIGYATRLYRRPAGVVRDWKGIFLQAAPPACLRAGVLFPIDGERWLVSVSGGNNDDPPTDEHGFLELVRALRSPILHETIREAEAVSPVYAHRGTENPL